MALLAVPPFVLSGARFSPDGRLVAYESSDGTGTQVLAQPWPFAGDKWPVSISGGRNPTWNPAGGELFYVTSGNDLMSVKVTGSNRGTSFGGPVRLFGDALTIPSTAFPQYAPSRDGSRFLLIERSADTLANETTPLVVSVNWQAALAPHEKQ